MTCALKYRNLRLGQVKSEPNIPVFEFHVETRFKGSTGHLSLASGLPAGANDWKGA